MDWSRGFTSKFIAVRVDPNTWNDTSDVYPILSGSVSRSADDSLIQSAQISTSVDFGEAWIRIYLIAEQDGEKARVPLFTGICATPTASYTGNKLEYSADCYSVLKVAADLLLPLGYYANRGLQLGPLIKKLLEDLPCEIRYDQNSPNLKKTLVADDSSTCLDFIGMVLEKTKWVLDIDGNGDIYIHAKSNAPELVLSSTENDVMGLEVSDSKDWFDCPNVLRVSDGDTTITVQNNDPNNPYSIVNRGRKIMRTESASLNDNETLAHCANRLLKEASNPSRIVSYRRRFYPDVNVNDLVNIKYPNQNLLGYFRITSQSFDLSYGCEVSEEVEEFREDEDEDES